MKFRSYDVNDGVELVTEIRSADSNTVYVYVQRWVPSYIERSVKDPNFSYSIFDWEKILKFSFLVGSPIRCYGAYTETRLEGLLCLSNREKVKVEFIATAPWNYYTGGRMRRIGTGLLFFVIKNSMYFGQEGRFALNAVPDAEAFYESIGMVRTGKQNVAGLREYEMETTGAEAFIRDFSQHIVEE